MPEGAGGARATPGSQQREGGPSGGGVWGGILILIGAIALVGQLDLPEPPGRLVCLGIVATSRKGLHGGLVLGLAAILGALTRGNRRPS